MNKRISKVCLGLALGLSLAVSYADVTPGQGMNFNASATEHVVWDGTPISFSVPVGQERLISFPSDVEFKNLDPSLTSNMVSITNNAGTLYIRALQPFSPIRTYVEIKSTGQIVYLDLSAQNGGDDNGVTVMTQSSNTISGNTSNQASSNTAPPNYISMLEYGTAQLYWPERLLSQLNQDSNFNDIARTPMFTTHSVNLIMGNTVLALPQASWRDGDLYVTAVLLLNPNKQTVTLDPFNGFAGDWVAKSFYPTNYLTPQGTANDRTVVFLVSDQPFNDALTSTPDYR